MKIFVVIQLHDDYNSISETYLNATAFRTMAEAEFERNRIARDFIKNFLDIENYEEQETEFRNGFKNCYWHYESWMNEYDYRIEIKEVEL